tara:strand:- start:694 stop:1134 length:441 start_codon:yes stop_codon:yes gene_type:complete
LSRHAWQNFVYEKNFLGCASRAKLGDYRIFSLRIEYRIEKNAQHQAKTGSPRSNREFRNFRSLHFAQTLIKLSIVQRHRRVCNVSAKGEKSYLKPAFATFFFEKDRTETQDKPTEGNPRQKRTNPKTQEMKKQAQPKKKSDCQKIR